jgi:L-asparaginase II
MPSREHAPERRSAEEPRTAEAGRAGRGYVPLVEVYRGDTVESIHFGAIAMVDAGGRAIAALGDPATVTFLRSAAKPAQVLPLLASGAAERFGFTEPEVAVMAGSHGGERFHVETVLSILAKIDLDEGDLQCGAHAPSHRRTAQMLRRLGAAPTALHNNCSGKHAGMLALARHLGAPVETYLEPAHPVQARIRDAVERLAGLPAGGSTLATDGCSAPNFAMPLGSAALLYARLLDPGRAPRDLAGPARRVVAAMRAHPEMVAGTDRLCTALIREGTKGIIAKIGAEGFYGLGYEDAGTGVGIALKIADGDGERARYTVALEMLRQIGLLADARAAALRARFAGEVRNRRNLLVGRLEPAFRLRVAAPAR